MELRTHLSQGEIAINMVKFQKEKNQNVATTLNKPSIATKKCNFFTQIVLNNVFVKLVIFFTHNNQIKVSDTLFIKLIILKYFSINN